MAVVDDGSVPRYSQKPKPAPAKGTKAAAISDAQPVPRPVPPPAAKPAQKPKPATQKPVQGPWAPFLGDNNLQSVIDTAPSIGEFSNDPEFKALSAPEKAKRIKWYHENITVNTARYRNADPKRRAMMDQQIARVTGNEVKPIADPYADGMKGGTTLTDRLKSAVKHGMNNTSMGNVTSIATGGQNLYDVDGYEPDGIGEQIISGVTSVVGDPLTYATMGVGTLAAKAAPKVLSTAAKVMPGVARAVSTPVKSFIQTQMPKALGAAGAFGAQTAATGVPREMADQVRANPDAPIDYGKVAKNVAIDTAVQTGAGFVTGGIPGLSAGARNASTFGGKTVEAIRDVGRAAFGPTARTGTQVAGGAVSSVLQGKEVTAESLAQSAALNLLFEGKDMAAGLRRKTPDASGDFAPTEPPRSPLEAAQRALAAVDEKIAEHERVVNEAFVTGATDGRVGDELFPQLEALQKKRAELADQVHGLTVQPSSVASSGDGQKVDAGRRAANLDLAIRQVNDNIAKTEKAIAAAESKGKQSEANALRDRREQLIAARLTLEKRAPALAKMADPGVLPVEKRYKPEAKAVADIDYAWATNKNTPTELPTPKASDRKPITPGSMWRFKNSDDNAVVVRRMTDDEGNYSGQVEVYVERYQNGAPEANGGRTVIIDERALTTNARLVRASDVASMAPENNRGLHDAQVARADAAVAQRERRIGDEPHKPEVRATPRSDLDERSPIIGEQAPERELILPQAPDSAAEIAVAPAEVGYTGKPDFPANPSAKAADEAIARRERRVGPQPEPSTERVVPSSKGDGVVLGEQPQRPDLILPGGERDVSLDLPWKNVSGLLPKSPVVGALSEGEAIFQGGRIHDPERTIDFPERDADGNIVGSRPMVDVSGQAQRPGMSGAERVAISEQVSAERQQRIEAVNAEIARLQDALKRTKKQEGRERLKRLILDLQQEFINLSNQEPPRSIYTEKSVGVKADYDARVKDAQELYDNALIRAEAATDGIDDGVGILSGGKWRNRSDAQIEAEISKRLSPRSVDGVVHDSNDAAIDALREFMSAREHRNAMIGKSKRATMEHIATERNEMDRAQAEADDIPSWDDGPTVDRSGGFGSLVGQLWHDEGGSMKPLDRIASDIQAWIENNRSKHVSIPVELQRTLQPDGTSASGATIYKSKNGSRWEHVSTDGDKAILREVRSTEKRARESAGGTFNRAFQPIQNLSGDMARVVVDSEAYANAGQFWAGRVAEKLVKYDPERRGAMLRALDDPDNQGGRNVPLTADEKAIVKEVHALMQKVGKDAEKRGLIERALDVFAPHLYYEHESAMFKRDDQINRIMSDPSAKRKYEFLWQAEDAGLNPVLDIASALNLYMRLNRKVAARDMLEAFRGMKASDGNSLIVTDRPGKPNSVDPGSVPMEYEPLNLNGFRGEYVHRDIHEAVKSLIGGKAESNPLYQNYMRMKQATIGLQLLEPQIHLSNVMSKALIKGGFAGVLSPTHYWWGIGPKVWGKKNSPSVLGSAMMDDPVALTDALKHDLKLQGNRINSFDEITGSTLPEDGIHRTWDKVTNIPGFKQAKAIVNGAHSYMWSEVQAMQLGLYKRLSDEMIAKGVDPTEAKYAAADAANTLTGMLNRSSMSELTRVGANMGLFSRGWTLGNMKEFEAAIRSAAGAALKDADVELRGMRPDLRSEAGKHIVKMMRNSVAADMIVMKVGLNLANKIMMAALGKVALLNLLSGWSFQNEEGKQNRFIVNETEDGRGIFSQFPIAKFTEDFTESLPFAIPGISEGQPFKHWAKKMAPLPKSMFEAASNEDGMGRQIYPDSDPALTKFAKGLGHVALAQTPWSSWSTNAGNMREMLSGEFGAGSVVQAAMRSAGASISHGFTGGKDAKARFVNEGERREAKYMEHAPVINRLLKSGQMDEAIAYMMEAKDHHGDPLYTPGEIRSRLKGSQTDVETMLDKYKATHPGFAESVQ